MKSGVAEKIKLLTTVSRKRKYPEAPTMQDLKKLNKERLSRSKTRKSNINSKIGMTMRIKIRILNMSLYDRRESWRAHEMRRRQDRVPAVL